MDCLEIAWPRKVLLLALIICLASGCTTTQPIPPEANVVNETLRPNDLVRITKQNGEVLELRVKEVTRRTVMGERKTEKQGLVYFTQEWVGISDIAKIEQIKYSHRKTAALIVGLVPVIIYIILTDFFAHGIHIP